MRDDLQVTLLRPFNKVIPLVMLVAMIVIFFSPSGEDWLFARTLALILNSVCAGILIAPSLSIWGETSPPASKMDDIQKGE